MQMQRSCARRLSSGVCHIRVYQTCKIPCEGLQRSLSQKPRSMETKISHVKWHCGFANVAQRLRTSIGPRSSRESMQGSVHAIADGKYSFKY